eukprot:CAMPEP_0119553628 /NCGR_PEP_ID=MMETSP1352-20130426/6337_1 /TAXON_ID=265584 /ORGANISM="Stauroneis constricta, Strain CCMP1120" /LENGTH=406 /DNA_ID=CAMNT_0007600073 /DNA_START=262 /DNA_END=1478 /DNA_ORIENTATION=+
MMNTPIHASARSDVHSSSSSASSSSSNSTGIIANGHLALHAAATTTATMATSSPSSCQPQQRVPSLPPSAPAASPTAPSSSPQLCPYVYKNTLRRKTKHNSTNSNSKKRVTFATEAIAHRHPLSLEEANSCWYTRTELAAFKFDRKETVRALKKVNFDASRIDLHQYCLRGYEAYSSIAFNKFLQKQRLLVTQSTMMEQERQRQLFVHMILADQQQPYQDIQQIERTLPYVIIDVERLRHVSLGCTEWAKQRAVEMALQDALELGYPAMTSIVLDSDDEEEEEDQAAWHDARHEDSEEDSNDDTEEEDDQFDDGSYSQYYSVHSRSQHSSHHRRVTPQQPNVAISSSSSSYNKNNSNNTSGSGSSNYDDEEPSLMSSNCSTSTHSSSRSFKSNMSNLSIPSSSYNV